MEKHNPTPKLTKKITQLRIYDMEEWEEFKHICRMRGSNASTTLRQFIAKTVANSKIKKEQDNKIALNFS